MNATELLDERLSDLALARHKDPADLDAFFALARIAIPCVLLTAAAGNVRCRVAVDEMSKHFAALKIK